MPNDQQAFPGQDMHGFQPGMSLRDWFAGQALIALSYQLEDGQQLNTVASRCYQTADAMLAYRAKTAQDRADWVFANGAKLIKSAKEVFGDDADEVPPLPEKWAIERTPINAEMVNAWANDQINSITEGHYVSESGYIHSHRVDDYAVPHFSEELYAGYPIITDEQFRRHVLKIR